MEWKSNWVRAAVVAGIAAHLGQPLVAEAQAYPKKPVRVVVAFSAGGFADGNGRQIAQKLSERLGQPFVIDNRGGAGGNYGAKIVADATPDGYTLLVTTAASSVAPSLYKNLTFHLLKDFTPISNTVSAAGVLSVLSSNPAKDLRDYIQRSRGRQIFFATAGVGTSSHIAADYLLRVLAKLNATHVPFKGGAPAVVAVLGGQVELLNSSGASLPYIKSGRMRGLAVASLKRTSAMPDVPTVAESGFPGFEERSWVGFFAPAKTPRAIINLLNKEINLALRQKDVIANADVRGMDIHPGSPEEFSRFVHAEVAKWAKMVKLTGVTLQ